MRLIFLSGLSGSGKSVALHMLEDLDFYCVDNIPAALLRSFISHTVRSGSPVYQRTAIGIDARNPDEEIATVPTLLDLSLIHISCAPARRVRQTRYAPYRRGLLCTCSA